MSQKAKDTIACMKHDHAQTVKEYQEEVLRLSKLVDTLTEALANSREHIRMLQDMVHRYQQDNQKDYEDEP